MIKAVKQVRTALSLISPEDIRKRSLRQVSIGLVARDNAGYSELEDFLVPETLPHRTRARLLETAYRAGDPNVPQHVDLALYQPGIPCPREAFQLRRGDSKATVEEVLRSHDDLSLALARYYPGFRKTVVDRIVHAVSRENALFAVASALPNVMPTLFELPWAFGEFASDTIFLTMNQFRMALQIAGASGSEVGLSHQKAEMASIAAGAFGWRALARELAGKIPLGGGLIPKGAIAYAATFAVGKGLAYYHHSHVPYTSVESEEIYQQALERGAAVAESLRKEVS
jgi:uncharacterized protein (DUF697 family)